MFFVAFLKCDCGDAWGWCCGELRTSAQALKRSATGQEPLLIHPAGPGREDLGPRRALRSPPTTVAN